MGQTVYIESKVCRSDKLLTIISLTPLLALGQQLAVHVTQSQVCFFCVCVSGELLVLRWTFVNTFKVPEVGRGD